MTFSNITTLGALEPLIIRPVLNFRYQRFIKPEGWIFHQRISCLHNRRLQRSLHLYILPILHIIAELDEAFLLMLAKDYKLLQDLAQFVGELFRDLIHLDAEKFEWFCSSLSADVLNQSLVRHVKLLDGSFVRLSVHWCFNTVFVILLDVLLFFIALCFSSL